MSFPIVFMYNNEPMNKINKSPETLFEMQGVLKDECSIVDPVILVERENPINANYAFIGAFRRYYYIKDIVAYRSNSNATLWEITMHTDVLRTFSEGILNSPAIIGRSSTKFNMYLNDTNYKCQQNDIIVTKTFPEGFHIAESSFVVTLLGDRVVDS